MAKKHSKHKLVHEKQGAFRKRVSYAWGRIVVLDKERKRRRKGYKEPTY